VGYVAFFKETGNAYKILVGKPEENRPTTNLGVDG
jgi:hypothetical protein